MSRQLAGNKLAADGQLNGNIGATNGNGRATGPVLKLLFLLAIFMTSTAP
jgi:hypothetical protein